MCIFKTSKTFGLQSDTTKKLTNNMPVISVIQAKAKSGQIGQATVYYEFQ